MIKLHQFVRTWNIPNLSHFCCKLETYLRLTERPYEIVHSIPPKSPKGKLPFIEDGDEKMADSDLIIQYLIKKYGDTLDADLTPSQKAVSLSMRRLFEEHLFWITMYTRWQFTEENWQTNKTAIFHVFPPVIRDVVAGVYRKSIRKQIYGQGIGRHSSEEIFQLGRVDLDAISDFLADKPYFMGDKPTSLDATAYGFLVNTMVCPIESPVKEYALGKQNLVDYCQRMTSKYYPEFIRDTQPGQRINENS
ncbi:MAG: glutathione S-transferase family protein [Nitrosomonas sp.]|nr:glutathione S-transferase family protein [Nitrosomonas sp.]